MIVAFPYCAADRSRALAWLQWAAELGGCRKHEIILMPAKSAASFGSLVEAAGQVFGKVSLEDDYEGVVGWPQGPNSNILRLVCKMNHENIGPVLHLENDCIPLVPDWLDRIETEYFRVGKPFMGALVQPGDITPDHLTGNMVMPWNAVILAPMLGRHGIATGGEAVAFDIAAASQILPEAHFTKLIQQVFNTDGKPPTFPNQVSLSIISPEAVLFHRSKDESLIQRMRELRRMSEPSDKTVGFAVKLNTDQGVRTSTSEEIRKQRSIAFVNAVDALPDNIFAQADGAAASAAVQAVDRVASAPSLTPPRPSVFTYFAATESAEGVGEQHRILEIWRQTWEANGWDTEVLTEYEARDHPRYDEWRDSFMKLPTVNKPGYEMACWLRYVAMLVQGGGLLTDYDCLNFGFLPGDANFDFEDNLIPLFKGVPCAIIGGAWAYEHTINRFVAATELFEVAGLPGQPHVSDMHLIQKWNWRCEDIGREYNTPGWQEAKLVHFGHFSCRPKLRSEVMSMANVLAYGASKLTIPEEKPTPKTWIGDLRQHVAAIAAMVDTNSRKHVLQTELRKAKLIGEAKKRK